ncbi:unnamed protein product [Linum tenue]|uniref:Uncharacterized protein n=1 Tax=Linum tenue TaxID=586396 RepID=A0AAV0IXJ0_9ROSI|nr:unnamed protein product [Linum tenue]
MENSMGVGLMAAFAVSGSVALISTQLHKRLISNFMDKIEVELGGRRRRIHHHKHKHHRKQGKRVRFAEEVMEFSPVSENYEDSDDYDDDGDLLGAMPVNRQMLYKGLWTKGPLRSTTSPLVSEDC